MTTPKQKAEQYVREKCPELMELSFGCEVYEPDDKDKVTYYIETEKSDKYELDTSIDPNPAPHFYESAVSMGKVVGVKNHGWGRVPFVPLWNNEEHTTDLEPVKDHIDLYDIIVS